MRQLLKQVQKLSVATFTTNAFPEMPYTRSQTSAAQSLVTMRFRRTAFNQDKGLYLTQTTPKMSSSLTSKFWTEWTNWYHTFLAEVTDEFPSLPMADLRSEATSRWVSYAANQLRCSEPQLRAWLRTANQNDLLSAYA